MNILLIIIALIFVIGWIPLGIGGILALRKKQRASGLTMSIVASLWCLVSLFSIMIGAIVWYAYSEMENHTPPENFDIATYQGKTGKIKLDSWDGEASFTIKGTGRKRLNIQTKNGILILPIGEHQISCLSLTAKDKNNKTWHASVTPGTWKNPFKIDVEENKTAIFQTGEPFNIEVTSRKKIGGLYTFSLSMKDKAGNKAMIYTRGKGKPAVQLLDEKEKILWEKALEYG
jgi:energy-coupling factor transporter transmembrane protein EcfT